MYAIVEIAGQQFKVAKDQKVYVNRLSSEEGSKVSFDNVLLIGDGDNITLGAPAISGALVGAKVTRHLKGDKVIVFKKKRRKGYRVKNGHRQALTEISIEGITVPGGSKNTSEKAPKTVTKSETPKKEISGKEAIQKGQTDDLKKIEGIGPKIADIFNAAGILTFADLADAKIERLKEILSEAGARYGSKNPGSWPKQARMAADGKWDELKEWQDNIKGGIE